jgi:hypothetical protein
MNRTLRAFLSLAAGMFTMLLVAELAAPVSAADRRDTACQAGSRHIDSSAGLNYAQITRRHGTIHSRPATNPTTPPAPLAVSVAPTYLSIGLRGSGN